ncbi:hypothetical protein K4R14_01610 [Staphylococcus epidermidis]|uniref:hypothetical protein n=1 Tax=Staphylococcus epidermidis TaxID=1282 RepID=UPI0030EDE50C|nr:hypothetical protein [Staphylococcus epidermidis]MCG2011523.1 hypothetical protein [Staphylococcus epidermidis]
MLLAVESLIPVPIKACETYTCTFPHVASSCFNTLFNAGFTYLSHLFSNDFPARGLISFTPLNTAFLFLIIAFMPFLTAYDPPTLSDVPSFKLDGKLSIVFWLVLSGF